MNVINRRKFLGSMLAVAAAPASFSTLHAMATTEAMDIPKLNKSKAEWRKILNNEARYGVLFEEDTERSFSSPLNNEKRDGTFICAACNLPLFRSSAKFDSGTGWPSFTQSIAEHTETKRDFRMIWPRTEYHCARCGGHQGHLFTDGPRPTGQRWCNNGLALRFVPEGTTLPKLRS